ncbi:YhgE/Pip domain-containing protein, partial [Paenibacillus sp. TAF58]
MESVIKFLKHKMASIGLIAIFSIITLMGFVNFGSSSNPIPKDMPVAIVMLDKGVDLPDGKRINWGNMLNDNMISDQAGTTESLIKWTSLSSKQEAMDGLNKEKYYAALIIPD